MDRFFKNLKIEGCQLWLPFICVGSESHIEVFSRVLQPASNDSA